MSAFPEFTRFSASALALAAALFLGIGSGGCGRQVQKISNNDAGGGGADGLPKPSDNSTEIANIAVLTPGPLLFLAEPASEVQAKGLLVGCGVPPDLRVFNTGASFSLPVGSARCFVLGLTGLKLPSLPEANLTTVRPVDSAKLLLLQEWVVSESVTADVRTTWYARVQVDASDASASAPVKVSFRKVLESAPTGSEFVPNSSNRVVPFVQRSKDAHPNVSVELSGTNGPLNVRCESVVTESRCGADLLSDLKATFVFANPDGSCPFDSANSNSSSSSSSSAVVNVPHSPADGQQTDRFSLTVPEGSRQICGVKVENLTGGYIKARLDLAALTPFGGLNVLPATTGSTSVASGSPVTDRSGDAATTSGAPMDKKISAINRAARSAADFSADVSCLWPGIRFPARSIDTGVDSQGCLLGMDLPGMSYDFGFGEVSLFASDYIPKELAYFGASRLSVAFSVGGIALPYAIGPVFTEAPADEVKLAEAIKSATAFNAIYPERAETFRSSASDSDKFYPRRERAFMNPEMITRGTDSDVLHLDVDDTHAVYRRIPGSGTYRLSEIQQLNPFANGCTERSPIQRLTIQYAESGGKSILASITKGSKSGSAWKEFKFIDFASQDGRIATATVTRPGIGSGAVQVSYSKSATVSELSYNAGGSPRKIKTDWILSANGDEPKAFLAGIARTHGASAAKGVKLLRDADGRLLSRSRFGSATGNGIEMSYNYKLSQDRKTMMVGMEDYFKVKSIVSITATGSGISRLVEFETKNDFIAGIDANDNVSYRPFVMRYFDRSNDLHSTTSAGRTSKAVINDDGLKTADLLNDTVVMQYSYASQSITLANANNSFSYRTDYFPSGVAKRSASSSGFGDEFSCSAASDGLTSRCLWDLPAGANPSQTCQTIADDTGAITGRYTVPGTLRMETVYSNENGILSSVEKVYSDFDKSAASASPLKTTTVVLSGATISTKTEEDGTVAETSVVLDPESGVVMKEIENSTAQNGSSLQITTIYDWSVSPIGSTTTYTVNPPPNGGPDLWGSL